MSAFVDRLQAACESFQSLLCVGLDVDPARMPGTDAFQLNRAVVDATADLVCAYKPNSAFYEAEGEAGLRALKKTILYINETAPEIPIILDAKRADIGDTNEAYARAIFDELGVDAVTVQPYVGSVARAR